MYISKTTAKTQEYAFLANNHNNNNQQQQQPPHMRTFAEKCAHLFRAQKSRKQQRQQQQQQQQQ
jgi:hypothetical protein